MNKKVNRSIKFGVTLFVGVSMAYFVWLTWDKLTELIGNSTAVWIITGVIVLIGMAGGYLSIKKIIERFT